MRGYPAWPAKVMEKRNDGKYAVIFFGTCETANVQPTDIWPYDMPNTTKFCSEKNLARPLFVEGMEQMKQAFQGTVAREKSLSTLWTRRRWTW